MYEDLIKRLRTVAQLADKGLIITPSICLEAADAIEKLSMKLHGDNAAIAGMKREIERMVVADKPRWIPVTERLPGEMETVIVTDGKNVGYSFCVNDYGTLDFYSPWNITHWMPLPSPPVEE